MASPEHPQQSAAAYLERFEEASAARYDLRLYVIGPSPKSRRAIGNITRICEERLPGRYDLEVVDLYQHPEEAFADQVVAAPTLIKRVPGPIRRLIGDLSQEGKVLRGLGLLEPSAA